MRVVLVGCLLLTLLGRSILGAQTLTEAEIEQAIQLGLSGAKDVGSVAYKPWGCFWGIVIAGPFGRIANSAAVTKTNKQTFARQNVPPGMLLPVWEITVFPRAQNYTKKERVEAVYVQRKGPKGALPTEPIQPVHQVEFPAPVYQQWNIPGTSTLAEKTLLFESRGVAAYFDPATLPIDDFEVVLVIKAPVILRGEITWDERFTITQKDRARIR